MMLSRGRVTRVISGKSTSNSKVARSRGRYLRYVGVRSH